MIYYYLPLINAILNFIALSLLTMGYYWIKRGRIDLHLRMMLSAFITSLLFLVSYLTFHYEVGSVGFEGTGWIQYPYYFILITHIVGAFSLLPLVPLTLYRAYRHYFKKHRKIARWTWPIWIYVSVTGVVVYLFMLFTDSYDKLTMMGG